MAVTPEAALAASPAARLTADELGDVLDAEAQIDAHLSSSWNGTHTAVEIPLMNARIIGELVRRYQRAGWGVSFDPIPSATRGPRGEAVIAGLRVALVPVWKREEVEAPARAALGLPPLTVRPPLALAPPPTDANGSPVPGGEIGSIACLTGAVTP